MCLCFTSFYNIQSVQAFRFKLPPRSLSLSGKKGAEVKSDIKPDGACFILSQLSVCDLPWIIMNYLYTKVKTYKCRNCYFCVKRGLFLLYKCGLFSLLFLFDSFKEVLTSHKFAHFC